MLILALCSLLAGSALADDGWDIDLDSIDLGGATKKGEEMVTYTGAESQSAPDFAPGAAVTITHSAGTISVRCVDRKGISARLDYALEGTNRNALSSFGKALGLRAWGGATSGGVQSRIPGASSTIKSKELPLIVNLPLKARVRVNGGKGWVQITGCEGTVAAANRSGDIVIDGNFTNISATASGGNVDIKLTDDSVLSGTNRIQAPSGNVELALPMAYGGRIYAKAGQVEIRHMVDGSEGPSLVQGQIGEGKASLSITARDEITIATPDGF